MRMFAECWDMGQKMFEGHIVEFISCDNEIYAIMVDSRDGWIRPVVARGCKIVGVVE